MAGLRKGVVLSVLLAAVLAPSHARADLLDEEDEAEVKVEPKGAPAPAAPPPAASSSSSSESSEPPKPSPSSSSSSPAEPPAPSGGKASASKPHAAGESAQTLAPKSLQTGRKAAKTSSSGREPVHFESRGLKGLREAGTLELMQNVVVTQGDLRIEADRARVFFDASKKDVQRIVADGNVKIFKIDEDSGEKIKAFGDKVVFENKERTVVLEGNARLWRGADLVRGSKITYEMASGWIRADRVAGEVYPDGAKGNK